MKSICFVSAAILLSLLLCLPCLAENINPLMENMTKEQLIMLRDMIDQALNTPASEETPLPEEKPSLKENNASLKSSFEFAIPYQSSQGDTIALQKTWNTQYQHSPVGKIAAGENYIVALRKNGRVAVVGINEHNATDVSDWENIVALDAGRAHTVGLKADGTVVSVGYPDDGRTSVGQWTNIVSVAAGWWHTVGLKADGTVVAVGNSFSGQTDVGDWNNIVEVAAGVDFTVGLKADGHVVFAGNNKKGAFHVENWTDIFSIVAGAGHILGLKADGTVVGTGRNDKAQTDVDSWSNVIAIFANGSVSIGIRSDGSILYAGQTKDQIEMPSTWENIIAATLFDDSYYGSFLVGLKNDGTVSITGKNPIVHNTIDWTDIGLIDENSPTLDIIPIISELQLSDETLAKQRLEESASNFLQNQFWKEESTAVHEHYSLGSETTYVQICDLNSDYEPGDTEWTMTAVMDIGSRQTMSKGGWNAYSAKGVATSGWAWRWISREGDILIWDTERKLDGNCTIIYQKHGQKAAYIIDTQTNAAYQYDLTTQEITKTYSKESSPIWINVDFIEIPQKASSISQYMLSFKVHQ